MCLTCRFMVRKNSTNQYATRMGQKTGTSNTEKKVVQKARKKALQDEYLHATQNLLGFKVVRKPRQRALQEEYLHTPHRPSRESVIQPYSRKPAAPGKGLPVPLSKLLKMNTGKRTAVTEIT